MFCNIIFVLPKILWLNKILEKYSSSSQKLSPVVHKVIDALTDVRYCNCKVV